MLVAVDTGGTKTLVAGFTPEGVVKKSVRFPTPKVKSEYLDMLVVTIGEVVEDDTADTIVVAMPGIVKDGVAIWCDNLGWRNFAIQKELQRLFPGIPILIENDANLGGLGEARLLKTVPSSVLYVTISTGIGTGVITGGMIDPGVRLSEGGHSLVEYDGVVRPWEDFASGSAIHKTYGKFASEITSDRAWRQIADRISRGFLAIIPVLQPERIILGGSIGGYYDRYGAQLRDILKEKLPEHIPVPKITEARHPEEAVIYGCYYYALDTLATR